jgi:hypothetical protein
MSTHATVVVQIPQEKRGNTYSYRSDHSLQYSTPPTTIPIDANYVSIYIHFDGYEDGLGKDLTEYDTFQEVMEKVICGGDSSCIDSPYHGWRNEEWEHVKPKFSESIPNRTEEYQYLFTSSNKWHVRSYEDENFQQLAFDGNDDSTNIDATNISDTVHQITSTISSLKDQINSLQKTVDKLETIVDNDN